MRTFVTAWLFAAALLAGCGGGGTTSDVEPQTPATRAELIGTVTPGFEDEGEQAPGTAPLQGRIVVSVKGAVGIKRSSDSFGSGPANEHRTGLAELTGPYMLSYQIVSQDSAFLTSVATAPGRANLTPLTTLLVAQLLGTDPATAFDAYGEASPAVAARITDAGIAEAQAKVIAYLRDSFGLALASGDESFITAEFAAEAGDPMFDAIVALNAALAANGVTLQNVAQTIAAEARLCLTEKLVITLGGRQIDFCPETKAGTPEEGDPSVIRYVIETSSGNQLVLRVQADTLLDASLAIGTDNFACAGTACTGISLGEPAADLSRTAAFDAAAIGSARLAGNLVLPVPGVVLPVLPCDNNKSFLILPDRSVLAECVEPDDPLGIGGVLGGPSGYPRIQFRLGSALQVRLQDGAISSITALQPYVDAGTGRTVYFRCAGAECAGAALGPATINSDLGLDLVIRDLTLDDVVLRAVEEDGSPSSLALSATLTGQFTTVDYTDPTDVTPPPNDCAGTNDRFVGQPNYRPEAIDLCPVPEINSYEDLGDGVLSFFFLGYLPTGSSPVFSMQVTNGVVTALGVGGVGLDFACSTDCAGVTVSAPDGSGARTVGFTGTVLREVVEPGQLAEHTLTLNGSYVAPAAVPP